MRRGEAETNWLYMSIKIVPMSRRPSRRWWNLLPYSKKKKMEKEFVWSFIFYSLYLSAGFCWYWCPRSSSCRVMFPSQTFNALFCICFGYAERGRDIRSLELHRKGPPWRRHFPFNSFLITKKKWLFSVASWTFCCSFSGSPFLPVMGVLLFTHHVN